MKELQRAIDEFCRETSFPSDGIQIWRDDMGIGMSLDGDIWSNCLSRDEADHELACIFQGIRMGMEVSIK